VLGPMMQAAKSLLQVVSALFPMVDPIGGSPIFLALTRGCTPQTRALLARRIG
jgi:multiple antibiotic resistance protein